MSSRGVIFKSCTCNVAGETGRRRNRTCSRLVERGHGSWQFDCRCPRHPRPLRPGPPQWVPVPGRRHPGPRRRPRPVPGAVHRPALDRGTVAAVLADHQHVDPADDAARLHPARRAVPHPHLGISASPTITVRHLTAMFADLATTDHPDGEPLAPATLHRICARCAPRSTPPSATTSSPTTPPSGSSSPAGPARTPSSGPTNASSRGDDTAPGNPSPSGPPTISPRSSTTSPPTASTPCGGSSPCAACAAARRSGCAGATSTFTAAPPRLSSNSPAPASDLRSARRRAAASRRAIALDAHTVQVLREHARRQRLERLAAGHTLARHRLRLHPHRRPAAAPELPHPPLPHRLCQPRRPPAGPAARPAPRRRALAHEAGADLKTVQDQLGHASIVLTADTYTSVLPEPSGEPPPRPPSSSSPRPGTSGSRSRSGVTSTATTAPDPQHSALRNDPRTAKPQVKPLLHARMVHGRAGAGRSTQRAIAVHTGRTGRAKAQVTWWAARDSNPEPTD